MADPAAHSYPFAYTAGDLRDLSSLTTIMNASGRLVAWVEGFVAGAAADTLLLLKDLNAGILGSVAYPISIWDQLLASTRNDREPARFGL